jgi:hypothetical protein
MTPAEQETSLRLLNIIQAKQYALDKAEAKVLELLQSNDGFATPGFDNETAIEIYKWMSAEAQSYKELNETKAEYINFMKNMN